MRAFARDVLCALLVACGSPPAADAGLDAAPTGEVDAGQRDAGRLDAGVDDAGPVDDGRGDAGAADAGLTLAQPGEVCSDERPCARAPTMACEGGPSCGEEWRCAERGCGDGPTTFCGCDGETVTYGTTCPSRPFLHEGACAGPDGFDCNPIGATPCPILPQPCERGWTNPVTTCIESRCVPVSECGCSSDADCPAGSTCDGSRCRL